jgi:hypothetical protein
MKPTIAEPAAKRTKEEEMSTTVSPTPITEHELEFGDFMMLNPLSDTHATRAAVAQAIAVLRGALHGA